MFKKVNRLTTKEFSEFYKSGKKAHSKHLTFVFKEFDTLKVAVVVGKKVAKSAVRRNVLKRRALASLKSIIENKTGIFIIILKPTYSSLPRKTAEKVLREEFALLNKSK